MHKPTVLWYGGLGAALTIDYWCHRNATEGDTLSECTRALFRTHHPVGRLAFVCAWAGLSCWLVPHINRRVDLSAFSLLPPKE